MTGGTGFIGGYVVEELARRGYQPVILDRAHEPRNKEFEAAMGTVTDRSAVDLAVGNCDGVIHLAAILGTQETVDEPAMAFEVNVRGSINVFRAVRRYKLPCVYIGVGNYWMNNPYSITKHAAERLAFMFTRECATPITVVRGYNAYGPRQKVGPVRKIIPNFVIPALQNKPLVVYGDGSQTMDMIYVTDIARILVDALEHPREAVIEAGSGVPTTVAAIAELVVGKVGKGSLVFVAMRRGEPPGAVVLADPPEPGPRVSLSDGLDRTIPYYASVLEADNQL